MRRAALACLAFAALVASCGDVPNSGQQSRTFPQSALRGAVVVGESPEIALNGKPARLAPGARIRDASNMSVVPGALIGGRYLVHYTVDTLGLVKDMWILRPEEAAVRPWPTTPQEAQTWTFDPGAQVWMKP